jgi:hypothetical protein
MAINAYEANGKKLYEVYINGSDLRGKRIQRRKRGIETIRKAENIQCDYERELAKLREEGIPLIWEECIETIPR